MDENWPTKTWPAKTRGMSPATWATDPADAPLPGCTFGQAVRRFYGRYARFSGRASRSEYWKIWLPFTALGVFCQLAGTGQLDGVALGIVIAIGVLSLVSLVPGLALAVRRLHDANYSGWYLLLAIIPFVGLVLLILCALPSNPEGERFDRRILQLSDDEGS